MLIGILTKINKIRKYSKTKSNKIDIIKNIIIFSIYLILIIFQFVFVLCDKEVIEENDNNNSQNVIHYIPSLPTVNAPSLFEVMQDIIPPEIQNILQTLSEKINDFNKTFIEEEKKVKDNLSNNLKERDLKLRNFFKKLNKKLEEAKKKGKKKEEECRKKNKEDLKKYLKELNKNESEAEQDILINEANKIHFIFHLGIDLTKPMRELLIDHFKKKINNYPQFTTAIQSKINEINNYNPKDFLNSEFGKPLKEALEKKGFNDIALINFRKKLLENRSNRRKNERNVFFIEKNEFEGEENNLDLELSKFIEEEYKDLNFKEIIKKEFKKFCVSK